MKLLSVAESDPGMEIALDPAIKTEPLLVDSEESQSEKPRSRTSPIHDQPEDVFMVMPKTEPDYPEANWSIKEENPEYHDVKQEVSFEEEEEDPAYHNIKHEVSIEEEDPVYHNIKQDIYTEEADGLWKLLQPQPSKLSHLQRMVKSLHLRNPIEALPLYTVSQIRSFW
ncbi:uncharacterized protein [Anabrus simplex]|uniref:uncharacterized protein isoform X3 n=1 Tax=Anabrus simplex TaxID=316456 RepID=UPI0035A2A42E